MNPGALNQRVVLSRATFEQDEIGQMVEAWAPLATVWAAVEPQAGREFIAGGAGQSELTTKVRIRYRPGITSADRVSHNGKTYNIASVVDYRSARRELVLMCKG